MGKEIKINGKLPYPVVLISFWKKTSWPQQGNISLEWRRIWFFLNLQEVKPWNSPWRPPQSYSPFVQMGKLRSKEVSNDLLGPMGRWGLEWRVKANTQLLSSSHLTKSIWKSKGKGSLLRCRAEQRRAENGSGRADREWPAHRSYP